MKTILRLTLTLFLICAVVAAALAGINAITAPRIAQLKEQKVAAAIAAVLPGTAKETTDFVDTTGLVQKVWQSESGYAVQVAPSGFGGTVTMMVGVDFNGKVLGIDIVSHTETAGLGDVAASDSTKGQAFRNQFRGQTGSLAVSKDGGTIDAITSATITSRAVTAGVNAAIGIVVKEGA